MSDPSKPEGDDQPTTRFSPPAEVRTPYPQHEPSWAHRTPEHWLEPLPAQPVPVQPATESPPRRERRGVGIGFLVLLFAVALLASALGSAGTYALLQADRTVAQASATPAPTNAPVAQTAVPSIQPAVVTDEQTAVTLAAQMVSPAVVTITTRVGEATDPFSLPEAGVGSGIIY